MRRTVITLLSVVIPLAVQGVAAWLAHRYTMPMVIGPGVIILTIAWGYLLFERAWRGRQEMGIRLGAVYVPAMIGITLFWNYLLAVTLMRARR